MLKRFLPRREWSVIVVLATLIFLILSVRFTLKNLPQTEPLPPALIVSVQGEVEQPGVYLLDGPEATVAEAIAAAGGIRKGVPSGLTEDLSGQRIISSQLIRVSFTPPEGLRIRFDPLNPAARLTIGEKLDVNEASEDDLSLVPLMKKEQAQTIVGRRREKPWREFDELMEIPGVGPKTLEKWKEHLEVRHETP